LLQNWQARRSHKEAKSWSDRYIHLRFDFLGSELESVLDYTPKISRFDPIDPQLAVAL
jgi:hypothetical protein